MNGGLDGRASGGEKRKVYPNNHTIIVEGRNSFLFMLSVCSVNFEPFLCILHLGLAAKSL